MAEDLVSERLHNLALTLHHARNNNRKLREEIASLSSRLSAVERERDAATAKERERCKQIANDNCRCHAAFTDRGLIDPACSAHDIADEIDPPPAPTPEEIAQWERWEAERLEAASNRGASGDETASQTPKE